MLTHNIVIASLSIHLSVMFRLNTSSYFLQHNYVSPIILVFPVPNIVAKFSWVTPPHGGLNTNVVFAHDYHWSLSTLMSDVITREGTRRVWVTRRNQQQHRHTPLWTCIQTISLLLLLLLLLLLTCLSRLVNIRYRVPELSCFISMYKSFVFIRKYSVGTKME